MERVTDEAGLPWQTGEASHLPVGSNTATRYLRHDLVDPLMQTF
jgi:hypothetical protein